MIKILKNKKGMSLMELIVGMLLFTIVTTSVSAILFPMMRIYAKTIEISECNALLNNVANQMISDLSESVAEPKNLDDENILSIRKSSVGVVYTVGDDGILYKKSGVENAVFLDKNYYKGRKVNFICTSAEGEGKGYILTITILSDENTEIISRNYAVKPLVLNQY